MGRKRRSELNDLNGDGGAEDIEVTTRIKVTLGQKNETIIQDKQSTSRDETEDETNSQDRQTPSVHVTDDKSSDEVHGFIIASVVAFLIAVLVIGIMFVKIKQPCKQVEKTAQDSRSNPVSRSK